MRTLACLVACLVVAGPLAGCFGQPREQPGYRPEEHGHLVQGDLAVASAGIAGARVRTTAAQLTLHLEGPPLGAPWRAVVVEGVILEGGPRGTLFLLPEATLELTGKMGLTYTSVALSAANLTGYPARTDSLPSEGLGSRPAGTDATAWEQASMTQSAARPFALEAEVPVTVSGGRALLAAQDGLRELTGPVVLESAASWSATTDLRAAQAPVPVDATRADVSRVQVFLAEPSGALDVGGTRVDLRAATVLDGIQPSVRLVPAAGGARAEVRLRAFQLYHGEEVMLAATLVAEPRAADVTLRDGNGTFRLRLREATGDADALFRAVRTEGPARLDVPGFESVWDSWPAELRTLMLMGPWAVNFAFATVFLEVLRLLTGAYLPQPFQAGYEHTVTVGVQGRPGEGGRVVLEGRNFPQVVVEVRAR